MRKRLLAGVQVIAMCLAHAAHAQTLLQIPPIKTTITLDQQPIEISVRGTVTPRPSGAFALALTVDLGDFQEHLTPVLSAQLNRSDRCGDRLSVEHAALAPQAPSSVLTANVNYQRYACVKALGKQILKRLVGGHGVIEVKLTPEVADNNISLQAEVRNVTADGSLGDVLRSGSFGDSFREDTSDSVESAIQKSADLRSTLPAEIGDSITIQAVQFADGGAGKLWLTIAGEARVSSEQMRRAVGQLERYATTQR